MVGYQVSSPSSDHQATSHFGVRWKPFTFRRAVTKNVKEGSLSPRRGEQPGDGRYGANLGWGCHVTLLLISRICRAKRRTFPHQHWHLLSYCDLNPTRFHHALVRSYLSTWSIPAHTRLPASIRHIDLPCRFQSTYIVSHGDRNSHSADGRVRVLLLGLHGSPLRCWYDLRHPVSRGTFL